MNTITMREFGKWGRWGNQLFQYAFLKIYASKWGCELQLPPWVGNVLLAANDPPITVALPQTRETTDKLEQGQPPNGAELVGRDYQGYAQFHTGYYRPHEERIRNDLWLPSPQLRGRMRPAMEKLWGMGKSRIGIHLRRGDFGRLCFYVTPVDWYLRWLDEHWKRFEEPVLFIATETPDLVREFSDYHPVTTTDLGIDLTGGPMEHYQYLRPDLRMREPWQMDFFPDWCMLASCDVVLAPNSTFSFTAAMAGDPPEFWRSSLPAGAFVQEDVWDTFPFQHVRAEDYCHIPGVCLDETEYWVRLPDGRFREK